MGCTAKKRGFMPGTQNSNQTEQARIVLGLLDSVERDYAQTNRQLASELGIALGLANAYLRRCIRKGLVKVRKTPARRYAYFLTPRGLAEKSRLTAEYLSYSFSLFRQARTECTELFREAMAKGMRRFALAGCSDLAEIAILCAGECGVEIVAIVDPGGPDEFIGYEVVPDYAALPAGVDAILLTNLALPRPTYESTMKHFRDEQILLPPLLKLTRNKPSSITRRSR